MQPNQEEIDEALAASLLYDDPESTICDTVTHVQTLSSMPVSLRSSVAYISNLLEVFCNSNGKECVGKHQ